MESSDPCTFGLGTFRLGKYRRTNGREATHRASPALSNRPCPLVRTARSRLEHDSIIGTLACRFVPQPRSTEARTVSDLRGFSRRPASPVRIYRRRAGSSLAACAPAQVWIQQRPNSTCIALIERQGSQRIDPFRPFRQLCPPVSTRASRCHDPSQTSRAWVVGACRQVRWA